MVLGAFHNIPGQSFAFIKQTGFEPALFASNAIGLPLTDCNLPRCADPVASTAFGDQYTTHLLSFSLRDTQRSFKNPGPTLSSLRLLQSPFLAGSDNVTTYSPSAFVSWIHGVEVSLPNLTLSVALGLSFRTMPNLLPSPDWLRVDLLSVVVPSQVRCRLP